MTRRKPFSHLTKSWSKSRLAAVKSAKRELEVEALLPLNNCVRPWASAKKEWRTCWMSNSRQFQNSNGGMT